MQRILAAIDFSDSSPAVIAQAAQLARCFEAKLWLLHVAMPEPEFVGYDVGPQHERDWRAAELRGEHRQLHQYALDLDAQGLHVTPLLIPGYPVEQILHQADKLLVDTVILGAHGHSALYHALMGSVCEGVLRATARPLLIVPVKR